MYIKFKVGDIDEVLDGLSWMYKMHIQMSIEVEVDKVGCRRCRCSCQLQSRMHLVPDPSQHGSYAATPKYKYKPIKAEIQTQIYTEYNNNFQLEIAMNQKWTVAW